MCDSDTEDRMVIPPAVALEIIRKANKIYLRKCVCRAQEQNCARDTWEVCLLIESASQIQNARPISTNEALSILETTAKRKVIYNLFYTRVDQKVTEICSCCDCCCHPLLQIREDGNYNEQIRSEYVAMTDATRCVGCGSCVDECFFNARLIEEGIFHLIDERCFGCGKCINICPEDAIGLKKQDGRGMPIPPGC